MIELHGGSIEVESEVNKWTEFTIKLPNKKLKICCWCGQCKDTNEYYVCNSKVKLVTKDKKLKMYIRD